MSKEDTSMIIKFAETLNVSLVVNGNDEYGYQKVLVFNFKDTNGDIYSVALPQTLVKKHAKKEDANGESRDRDSGSEENDSAETIEKEGSAPNSEGED